jgi:putative tRNA adenosine deaminase-associated protein
VPYFTAVLARRADQWVPRAVDIDDTEDLDALADRLRLVAVDDEPVLLLLEHEDEWFAVVRVDGDEDPRVFVSDVAGAGRSTYGEVLGLKDDEAEEDVGPEEGPVGDLDLLDDLGTPADRLLKICTEDELIVSEALESIAAAAGFGDVLDAMR